MKIIDELFYNKSYVSKNELQIFVSWAINGIIVVFR